MCEVEEEFKEMHYNTVNTYEYLLKHCDDYKFLNYPIDEKSNSFNISSPKNNMIIVKHSIETGGGLETILMDKNDNLKYDTLEYHDTHKDLLEYLKNM